ncbi:flavin-containing monooxygenase [Nocardiopsis salina]|uniref:flavin-containing monooxygenase n=1 Tax=Nocardiopsis salina TaxID=245836 RepID=UPI00034A653C|nr:NAD(P)/FAD-dependent oxidoreductase [Nocardiopsis salina]
MNPTDSPTEHLDVLVVGAGISGIGAARYLKTRHPRRSFAILEARDVSGGTWDLFRYPGIRSDSDLYTFGYDFRPWRERESIATAPRILNYLRETATESGLDPHIRYRHRVVAADWSSEQACWQVEVERTDTGQRLYMGANWIFCASGYYRYDQGHTPHFEGRERFGGRIVHPQHWPEDLDHTGKRVVVIGSGATAFTLVPAMSEQAEHVTMLQRTPTYVVPVPREDGLAALFTRLLGPDRGSAVTRRKNIIQQRAIWELCRRFPRGARKAIRAVNARQLPTGYPVDQHFNPPYDPWDQRLCLVPDGDFFREIRRGRASVATDRITTFVEHGVQLESGRELPADIIVTATGLTLQIAGGIELSVDGEPVSYPDTVVHRGKMLSGVPNFSLAVGYTNASWTLKIGLLCDYWCRLLSHMDARGHDTVVPVAPEGMDTRPLLDFDAGYVRRALDRLPRQGAQDPWLMSAGYHEDRKLLSGSVEDPNLRFSGPGDRVPAEAGSEASPLQG